MQDIEVKTMFKFIKVIEFFRTYLAFFHSLFVKEQLAIVEEVVNELKQRSATQITSNTVARENSTIKALLRNELRDDMALINRMARAIALSKSGFDDKFRMPRPGSDRSLLAKARSFAENAAPFVDEFVKREMPADFLETLQTNIDQFEKAIQEKVQGTRSQVTASAAIDDAIERGMTAVRQLDPIVRVKFENDAGVLAAWLSASRAERKSRSAAPTTPSPVAEQ